MVNTQEHIWNRNFIFITIGNGLLFVNFHMLVPTIAMYAASIGSSGSEIGIIAGIFALSAIVVRLFTDALVGKLGKKRCLFLGLLTSLIATAGYGLFPTFGGLMAARILHGFGFGLSTTFAAALAVEVIPPEHRGEGVGYFGLGNTISMGSAPAHRRGRLFGVSPAGTVCYCIGSLCRRYPSLYAGTGTGTAAHAKKERNDFPYPPFL